MPCSHKTGSCQWTMHVFMFSMLQNRDAFWGMPCPRTDIPFESTNLQPLCSTMDVLKMQAGSPVASIRIRPYLDNWLLSVPTKEQAIWNTFTLIAHIMVLNFTVNALVLKQATQFTCVKLASLRMLAMLSPEHAAGITLLTKQISPGCSIGSCWGC